MQKKVSLKDVAARVGVSATLVSYVINNKEKEGRVGKEMAKKIKKAARDMNYQPNLIARSLKFGRTKTIGLIVADISNPFFSHLARIIENEAKKNGYTVIFGSSDENLEKFKDLINTFLSRQVDGLIITPVQNSAPQIKDLLRKEIPFVQIDRYFPGLKANAVYINNYTASSNGVRHLIQNGYKKPGMIAYESSLEHLNQRLKGFEETVTSFNYKPLIELVPVSNSEALIKALDRLIEKKKVDCILFGNISIAIKSLYHIRELNKKVPEELGLLSYDQSDVFDFFYAPITFIRQPLREMGERSVNILINQLNGVSKSPEKEIFETELVIRKSSGS